MGKRTGRVVLVTGGAQGIGQGIARWLYDAGMTVVIADMDGSAAEEWLADMGRPEVLHAVCADVTREDDVARMVAEAVRLGGRLDALVNNAGIGAWKPFEALGLDEWNHVLATNLTSIFLAVKHASPHLRASRGAVVNIASTRALQSERNGEAYAASKGGVVALTHALAVSLGPDVRVNAISPGWIEVRDRRQASRREAPVQSDADRAQHPVGRVGVPEDVASLVEYLLSPEAGFITGQNFVVDGGMTKKMIYV